MVVTRFAPAPTGFLHLGHIVNALQVWDYARSRHGRVLLRVEDHDRQRSRPEYETALLDDLEWLGFVPDQPSIAAFRAGPCAGRQSDRAEHYQAALDRLRAHDLVYACECSRREIVAAGGTDASGAEVNELWYPGTCAGKHLPERDGLGLRVRMAKQVERFEDVRHGWQEQAPSEQCGDLLIRDRAGNWTYQFAVTVDDFAQGVTTVIRGDDLLSSTGRQIQLARLLGRIESPQFLHHPLVMKTPMQKLSKSSGATGIREWRANGHSPQEVIELAREISSSGHLVI